MSPRLGKVRALVRERAWTLTVWSAMLGWTIVLASIARRSYDDFGLARFDLGNMVQAVWSTAHGHPLEMTNGSTGEQMVRLGTHVDPILVLLTPFWILWPSPLSLAFVQIAAVAAGALPVFWLARRHLGSEKLGCVLALAYLAYPWLSWSAIGAIHPVTFAIPLFLYAIWFLDSDRLWAFAPFAVLAALTGELMGVTVAALGLWFALARGRRVAGLAITALGLGWVVFAVYVVVPRYSSDSSVFYGFYDQIGGSPTGVLRTAFTDPGAIASTLLAGHVIAYLLWLAVPLAGLFLLSPALAAVAVPALLVDGLSDFREMTDPRYHDVAGVDSLPHRRHRARLQQDRAARQTGLCSGPGAGAVAGADPRHRSLAAGDRKDPLRNRQHSSVQECGGAGRRRLSRPCGCARQCIQRRRRAPLGSAVLLRGARGGSGDVDGRGHP